MDREDLQFIFIMCTALIAVCVGVYYGISYIDPAIKNNVKYEITFTVQAYEHSTLFFSHTNILIRTLGGDETTLHFYDYQEYQIGKTYHITYISRLQFTPAGFQSMGEIQKIEEVKP